MAEGQGRTGLMADFRGENYRLPDALLPPNVSPDALNCDYFRGTVAKRPGWVVVQTVNPLSPACAETVILGVYFPDLDDQYIILGSPGTTKYDLYFVTGDYLSGFSLDTTETNVLERLWAFRMQQMDDGIALWWRKKLPGWDNLRMDPIDVSSTTATPSGSGSFNGVRKYRFVCRNSNDGHESDLDYSSLPGSAEVTSGSASSASQYDIASIPVSSDSQVDKIRIYATKTGGSSFYYMADINNGTTTYTDTTADSALTVPYNGYRGALPELGGYAGYDDHTPMLWQERLWAPGLEDGRVVLKWSERSYGDGLPIYCLFYPDNYLELRGTDGEPWDMLPVDDSYMLLAFHQGVFAVIGDGPSTYRCIPVITGSPFYSLCLSSNYVYAFGADAVVRFPRGSLGPVEDISGNMADEFAEVPEMVLGDNAPYARPIVSRYFRGKKEVWFTFGGYLETDLKYDERWTWVWSEDRETWARWDWPVDQYAEQFEAPESLGLWVGVQGQLGGITWSSPYRYDGKNETGTVSSSGATSVVVSEDPGGDDGFIGLTIAVQASDGTIQRRIIDSRSGTTINVTEAWDSNPSNGDAYWIGEIRWYWKSPRLALVEDRFGLKRSHRIKTAFRTETKSAEAVSLSYRFDSNTALTKTLDASKRLQEVLAPEEGRELRLEYSHHEPDETVEIEAVQVELEPRE